MPYTLKQHKLFNAAAHSKKISADAGIPMTTAKRMASEGIKNKPAMAPAPKHHKTTPQQLAAALRGMP